MTVDETGSVCTERRKTRNVLSREERKEGKMECPCLLLSFSSPPLNFSHRRWLDEEGGETYPCTPRHVTSAKIGDTISSVSEKERGTEQCHFFSSRHQWNKNTFSYMVFLYKTCQMERRVQGVVTLALLSLCTFKN